MGSAAAAAVGLPRRARAQSSPPLTTVHLGSSTGDDVTPVIYGMKSGIFAKYGLDLQIGRMVGAAAAAMIGGSFDISKSVITTLLDAHVKGLPITLVAAASINNPKAPYVGFLMKKDSPLQSGKDVNNQIVGVGQLGDISQVAMLKWVDDHGGDVKSIKFIDVPTTAAPPAVQQGRVYASESTQPSIQAAITTGGLKLGAILDGLGVGTVLTAWATTKDFSSKNPQVVRAFVRAYKEAATYTNAHHAETVAMMSEFSQVPADIVATMPRATAAPTLVAAQVQPMIEAAAKYGLLDRTFPAAEMIDPNAT